MVNDLKLIKKNYGEKMMHYCRQHFPDILENESVLYTLISENFSANRYLYSDLIRENKVQDFYRYIIGLYEKIEGFNIVESDENPFDLMKSAGYTLYKCETEEDIQSFKKFYKENEEICTFKGDRLMMCSVFFAIKDNVDDIKRSDFLNPQRDDEYGTSVISIQFYNGMSNNVSIKNRYNKTVKNPDSTFSNNLDNIAIGLTSSFQNYYNLKIKNSGVNTIEIPSYTRAVNGKLYKYNTEIDNVFHCSNNIVIEEGLVVKYPDEKFILMDNILLDIQNKNIKSLSEKEDSFISCFENINSIKIEKNQNEKKVLINYNENCNATIFLNHYNEIIKYENDNIKFISDNFLENNKSLTNLILPNVKKIGKKFLYNNQKLRNLEMPNLLSVENNFLHRNNSLLRLSLESLICVGSMFLTFNTRLAYINVPYLICAENFFLSNNNSLVYLNLPCLTSVGTHFLYLNNKLDDINIPNLKSCGNYVLYNHDVTKMYNDKINKM